MDYLVSHVSNSTDSERAARELDIGIEGLSSSLGDVAETVARLEGLFEPPTDEEVETFRQYIMSLTRTPEWDLVIGRIDGGEITWRELVSGELDIDPDVDAAMRSTPRIDPAQLTERGDEVSGEGGAFSANPVDSPPALDNRDQHWDTDDDYFQGSVLRG